MCKMHRRLNTFVQYFPLFITYFNYTLPNTMDHRLTFDVKNPNKSLLLNKASFFVIQKLYLNISLNPLTRYRKQFLGDTKIFKDGKLNKISKSTKFIFAGQLYNKYRLDSLKSV